MNNAEKFQEVFGYYATEMWAKPESEFLEWINSNYTPAIEVMEYPQVDGITPTLITPEVNMSYVEWLEQIKLLPSVVPKQIASKLADDVKSMRTTTEEVVKEMKSKLAPTIEQPSVVRCKDCTHYHASKHYAYCTVINVKGKHPQPNDYCSYAEEK